MSDEEPGPICGDGPPFCVVCTPVGELCDDESGALMSAEDEARIRRIEPAVVAVARGQMSTPKLKDPRDRWPSLTDKAPDGDEGSAFATLQTHFPSLGSERSHALARKMFAQPKTLAWLESFLREHAPELFADEPRCWKPDPAGRPCTLAAGHARPEDHSGEVRTAPGTVGRISPETEAFVRHLHGSTSRS